MRDDSSIDPAGTQQQQPQAPYASGPTPEQGTTQGQATTQEQVTQPQSPTAATGPAGTEQARGGTAGTAGTGVPTTPTPAETAPAQAQPNIAPEQGTSAEQGIWDATKVDEFRHRWHDVQTHFVEDPRGSVTEARQLVDEAVQSLADNVHEREEQLERAGARSSDSTEGMRDTVLQYHQLLDRLLTV